MTRPGEHVHWSEERLFDAAVDPESLSPAARAELASCPRCSAEAGALGHFLTSCRDTLTHQTDDAAARDVVQRVLTQTTREDLSWRGDWTLLKGYFAARWRTSWPVRVAAASLLLHVAALPVLAYYGFFVAPERRGFQTGIEPPPESLFEELVEEEIEEELGEATDLDEEPDVVEVEEELDVANAIQWARYHLEQGAPRADADAGHAITRMLALRARVITTPELAPERPAEADPADQAVLSALWLELLLDRFVLERRVPAGFSQAIRGLAPAGSPEERLLCAAALARARDYGLLSAAELDRLAEHMAALKATGLADLATRALSGGRRDGAPTDRTWLVVLERVAGDVLRGDAVGRAWLEWGR